jgi:hypothetical protein
MGSKTVEDIALWDQHELSPVQGRQGRLAAQIWPCLRYQWCLKKRGDKWDDLEKANMRREVIREANENQGNPNQMGGANQNTQNQNQNPNQNLSPGKTGLSFSGGLGGFGKKLLQNKTLQQTIQHQKQQSWRNVQSLHLLPTPFDHAAPDTALANCGISFWHHLVFYEAK